MKKELHGFYQAFSEAISNGMRSKLDFIILEYDKNVEVHCLFLLFIKSYRHFNSIKILCKNNIFQDSFVLLRCLFESVLCCVLFAKNNKHIERWVKYQQFIYFKEFLKDKTFIKQHPADEIAYMQKEYDALKPLFTNRDKNSGKIYVDRQWYQGGLRAAAIEADLLENYEFCYRIGSDFVHNSSKVGQFYIDLRKKEETIKMIVGTKPSKGIDPIIIFTSIHLMLCAVDAVSKNIEIMNESTIAFWDKRLSKKMGLYKNEFLQ
ncbi:MAG: hypothetical protein A2509_00920 [Candidatus Edwardsbacteria bacterium RIFOXYD12_FULL_50_11]|uniref:Uncharacterized protein n=1 Tax=Candidatus Edwardsbacteria bacterium GWF2_54_11 TaxID=1817851 RepID=A0A1F5RC62_9BACT|nr:MAG: hypothetical protein A2502_07555 [Candidatus Edwardsbacteria bacterium RifOxyC12_full_54_24]OGF07546.1 MAG: hypothetical protein A2273_03505 [Candidatus Edwardsbacteria bacterium RifOxyA12_full_54_48]OGF09796.1 MAG: hypothetical protein A3K15_09915 [Candidatus Edwardsbacteria bacterium GWE2_54_12]OGF12059.1 MAG: hypothetical protein A2024_03470 [Candidatus Edwardsbacteria bacterium GWF2_54_11]OGF16157.1 MAG: hypothetical protein A2509_00920 [Candidatus Edwardsbacteria bacterium RIFOXYD1